MTTRRPMTALAVLLFTLLSAAGCGSAAAGGEIIVSDARVPVPAGPNGAAYMTLSNEADSTDRLVAASTDVAGSVELHESSTDGGSMSMQRVDGIDIPAGGEAVLAPGGYHLMLVDVAPDLAEGDTVDLTLTFGSGDEQTVAADVVPVGDVGAMDMGSEPMDTGSEG